MGEGGRVELTLAVLRDQSEPVLAGPSPHGRGLLSFETSRNGWGVSDPSVPPVTPSPPTLSPNGERECIEFAARSYAIARLAHQRSPSARASSASRKRQPLL